MSYLGAGISRKLGDGWILIIKESYFKITKALGLKGHWAVVLLAHYVYMHDKFSNKYGYFYTYQAYVNKELNISPLLQQKFNRAMLKHNLMHKRAATNGRPNQFSLNYGLMMSFIDEQILQPELNEELLKDESNDE